MDVQDLQQRVEAGDAQAVEAVIAALDEGRLRVCEPDGEQWITHAWIKRAILAYFGLHQSRRSGGS